MKKFTSEYTNPFEGLAEEFSIRFDSAYETHNIEKLEQLIDEALLNIESLNLASQAQLYYSIGTSLGDLAMMSPKYNNDNNLERQLFYFRESLNILSTTRELDNEQYRPYILGFKMPLYTNYANCLDKAGRKIPALEYYNKAMEISSDFAMAIGNAGVSYFHYANIVYDPAHRDYFNYFAYHKLKRALSIKNGVHQFAEKVFNEYLNRYTQEYKNKFLECKLDIPQYTYEDSVEFNYRQWALNERLFLNPLNDLPVFEMCFAADVIHLPSMVVDIKAKPTLHGLYNQLKQEYVFTRFLYYESLQGPRRVHFADKDTYLLQFSDYPQYSIRLEKMKSSFRILYSLFDKVAFFLNEYFDLGIYERDVSFRSVWRGEKKSKSGKTIYKYKNILNPNDNFALSAIYWISKDIYEKLYVSPNPSAKELNDIRNSLEHKYVKIYSDSFPVRNDGTIDDLAYYLSESKLSSITLDMMKIVREVLINLSLAVHIEELKRAEKHTNGKNIPSIGFINFEDDWKL